MLKDPDRGNLNAFVDSLGTAMDMEVRGGTASLGSEQGMPSHPGRSGRDRPSRDWEARGVCAIFGPPRGGCLDRLTMVRLEVR